MKTREIVFLVLGLFVLGCVMWYMWSPCSCNGNENSGSCYLKENYHQRRVSFNDVPVIIVDGVLRETNARGDLVLVVGKKFYLLDVPNLKSSVWSQGVINSHTRVVGYLVKTPEREIIHVTKIEPVV